MKYRTVVKQKKDIGRVTETVVHFRHEHKNKELDVSDLEHLLKTVESGLGPNDKIRIRALNGQRYFTFKPYNKDLSIMSFDDYYKNSVRETTKFEKFSFIEVSVIKQKN